MCRRALHVSRLYAESFLQSGDICTSVMISIKSFTIGTERGGGTALQAFRRGEYMSSTILPPPTRTAL
jgi:hypothetical protein